MTTKRNSKTHLRFGISSQPFRCDSMRRAEVAPEVTSGFLRAFFAESGNGGNRHYCRWCTPRRGRSLTHYPTETWIASGPMLRFNANWFNHCALRHWEPSNAPNLSFVRFSNPWAYRAFHGCYCPEFRRARRCGRRDHRRCCRRSTRRGSGSRHGCRSRSPSRPTLAWPLLLASRSLLGPHRWKVAPRVFSLLQVASACIGPMP
jgi:hypothetical protein